MSSHKLAYLGYTIALVSAVSHFSIAGDTQAMLTELLTNSLLIFSSLSIALLLVLTFKVKQHTAFGAMLCLSTIIIFIAQLALATGTWLYGQRLSCFTIYYFFVSSSSSSFKSLLILALTPILIAVFFLVFRLFVSIIARGDYAITRCAYLPVATTFFTLVLANGAAISRIPKLNFSSNTLTAFFDYPNLLDIPDKSRIKISESEHRFLQQLERPASQPNIVIIVSDSLRADHLPMYGYSRNTSPSLLNRSQSGGLVHVDIGMSPCSETFCGVGGLLSSNYLQGLSGRSLKIYDFLEHIGYSVNLLLSGLHRNWPYLWDYLGKDRSVWDFKSASAGFDVTDDRIVLEGLAHIDLQRPAFVYAHLMSTHISGYRFLPSLFVPEVDASIQMMWNATKADQSLLEPTKLRQITNRYDNGIIQADHVIERIINYFTTRSNRESLFIIVGDHGEELGENGGLGHTHRLSIENVSIPILLYHTSKRIELRSDFGSLLDIAPTIFDLVGLPIPTTWRGVSLLRDNSRKELLQQTRRANDKCRGVSFQEGGLLNIYRLVTCESFKSPIYRMSKVTGAGQEAFDAAIPDHIQSHLESALEMRLPAHAFLHCSRSECF